MLAERARLVDVLAAQSLTTDLATGFPFERGLRACLVADGLARALELDPPDRRAAFLASLLRAVGCGHASENAASFGDDIAFERFLVTFDPGDEAVAGAQLAVFGTVVGAAAMQTFLSARPSPSPTPPAGATCRPSTRKASRDVSSRRNATAPPSWEDRWRSAPGRSTGSWQASPRG